MSMDGSGKTLREAVAVFDDAETLEAAIDDLERSGFDRAELSMLAGEETVRVKLGHVYTSPAELEDDKDVPRKAFVSRGEVEEGEGALVGALLFVGAVAATGAVVASGGTLAAIIAAAAASGGAGALIGGILATALGAHHADYLQHQIERGGILLWVRLWDAKDEEKALAVLNRHSAHDVHVHDLPA